MATSQPPTGSKGRAVIVGASLGGLMAALSISRAGLSVTLLERAADSGRTGAALQVGDGLLARLTGRDDDPTFNGARVQTWTSVHRYLRAAAESDPSITVHDGVTVIDVGQDADRAFAIDEDGCSYAGDVLVGADGYRSVVRRLVAPERPDAEFAGYVIWIGVSHEADLGFTGEWPQGTVYEEANGYILLGSPLPAENGSNKPGERRLGWALYDAGRNALLRKRGALAGNFVQRSLRPSDIPDQTYAELAHDACLWPEPWCKAIRDCVDRQAVIGTPIAEYLPDRLVKDRVGLVGDAAHVPTPMTGNGFSAALEDAVVLGRALARESSIQAALRGYAANRLPEVRRLVEGGQYFSRGYATQRRKAIVA